MKKSMYIHYDSEGDLFELLVGEPTLSYMKNKGRGIFERIDGETGKVTGFTIVSFKKKTENFKPIILQLPEDRRKLF